MAYDPDPDPVIPSVPVSTPPVSISTSAPVSTSAFSSDPDPDPWNEFPLSQHPLDAYLGGKLAGNGSAFEEAGQKYGVDPTLLAAIATFESGHGTSNATVKYNNPTGMMDPRHPSKFQKFDSIPDAIDATAANLSKNYLQQGLSTIPEIGAKYSPPGASNDPRQTNAQWPGTVEQIYRRMGGTRNFFGSQPVGPAVNIMRS